MSNFVVDSLCCASLVHNILISVISINEYSLSKLLNFFSQNEVMEMTISEYFRTYAELTKPFVSDESPVRKAGLTLVSVKIKEFPLPEYFAGNWRRKSS